MTKYTRTRQSKNDVVVNDYYVTTERPEGVIESVVLADNLSIVQQNLDTMYDVVTPNFRKRQAAGELFNNPMKRITSVVHTVGNGSLELLTASPYHKTIVSGDGSLTAWRFLGWKPSGYTPLDITDVDITTKVADAKTRCIAAMDSTPFAFLEDVAELRKTIKLLTGTLKASLKLIKVYKGELAKYSAKGFDATQAAARAWLVVRYGFRPLILSAWDAMEAYQGGLEKFTKPNRQTARSFFRDVTDVNEYLTNETTYTFDEWEHSATIQINGRLGILYENTNPISTWPEVLGFRKQDLLALAWDLTTFSFIIDRFIDIKSFIVGANALSNPEIKVLHAWITVEILKTDTLSFVDQTQKQGRAVTLDPDSLVTTERLLYREPWLPSGMDTLPVWKGELPSFSTITDILAIITSSVKI